MPTNQNRVYLPFWLLWFCFILGIANGERDQNTELSAFPIRKLNVGLWKMVSFRQLLHRVSCWARPSGANSDLKLNPGQSSFLALSNGFVETRMMIESTRLRLIENVCCFLCFVLFLADGNDDWRTDGPSQRRTRWAKRALWGSAGCVKRSRKQLPKVRPASTKSNTPTRRRPTP